MNNEKEFLIDNLAMLIDAGIDLLNALRSLQVEAHSSSLKQLIGKIIEDVDTGSTLSMAFRKNKMLPSADIALLEIGETSGRLAENLDLIASQNRKDRDFRSKIRSAMIYPAMVITLTFVIALGISWFILPKLATVFTSLKLKLPLVTKLLIGFGVFLTKYGVIAVPSFLICVGGIIYILFIYEKTKYIGENLLFSIPFLRKLIQEVEIARFGYLLGTLLDAGIPVLEALDSICASPALHTYKKLYFYLRDNIKEGNSFKNSFTTFKDSSKYIPHFVQEIVVAGELSGNLSRSLYKVGKVYEEKTENNTKNLAVMLEPIMLIVISLGVLGVAIAVILPIYSLVGNMNT